jgi:hypothetical protein
MRWMVIHKYGVPGGDLNLNSTNYPDHDNHGDPPLSGKNPHGRARNRTRDLMISSQKRRPLDHKAGLTGGIFTHIWPTAILNTKPTSMTCLMHEI